MSESLGLLPEQLVDAYLKARNSIEYAGFSHEIEWQQSREFKNLTESDLLREYAWVVMASGMNDRVVRSKFSGISEAFHWWQSADKIFFLRDTCLKQALGIFGNRRKMDAIVTLASILHKDRFPSVKQRLDQEGIAFIDSLPFMGPATSYHLAKNIGINTAKPDRHLVRLAQASGYPNPNHLCRAISRHVLDSVAVIDIVLWRYATLEPNYRQLFNEFV